MLGGALRTLSGAAVAVLLSQFPEFAQQYTQRIGGALDALRPIVEQFDASAGDAGLTRDEALTRLSGNPDMLVVNQTASTEDVIQRYESLVRQRAALGDAGEFERLWVFLRAYDPQVAAATYDDYRPAVPTTVEGLAHAGLGFAAGYALIGVPGALMRRRRRKVHVDRAYR